MATAQNGQMKSDWDGFFSNTPTGQATKWGGGMLQNLGNGKAFLSSGDVTNGGMYFDQADINNPDKLSSLAAQSQGVANEWAKYGITPNQEQANYAARDRAARVASGQALPSIAVHGSDADQNAAYFAANKNDPIAQYVREQSQGQNKYHTNTDWGGQYNLDTATGGSAGGTPSGGPIAGIINSAVQSGRPNNMSSDFGNYWATSKPGDSQPFGVGTLTRNADGSATYTNSAGVNSVLSMGDGIQSIADANPEIANAWRDQYGYKSAGTTATPWNVSQDMTVQGQLGKVMDPNSPLMQQAKTQGLQFANDRGLLNSSMAQSAAQDSMYKAALPIASADASMYGKSASENASNATQIAGANISANTSLSNTASNNATSVANTAANNATSIANAKMQTEAAAALGLNDATYKQLTQGSASAAQLMTNYQSQLGSLLRDSSYSTPEARQAAVDQLTNATKAAINIVGATAGNVDLAQYINQLFPE